jgi:hypothetical protein
VPMLGVTSNSGSSSSKPLTKALREAPLLKLATYNPLNDACWAPNEAAPYLAVALTLAAIDGTSSRLLIADGLTNMFRSLMLLAPGQVTAAAYLVCGKLLGRCNCACSGGAGICSRAGFLLSQSCSAAYLGLFAALCWCVMRSLWAHLCCCILCCRRMPVHAH